MSPLARIALRSRGLATSATQQAPSSKSPVEIKPKEKDDQLTTFKGKKFPDFESTYRRRGMGGRSSFNGLTATVFNGSSFVGQNVIARLGKTGTQIVIAYRGARYTEEKMKLAGDLGQIYFSKFNLKDEESLYEAMKCSNVVINCIGSRNETKNFSYEETHIEGPRRMARIARELGVKKFIHFSALNCGPAPTPWCIKTGSKFLKTKYYGEQAVLEEFPDAVIFRPSDIVGERDDFVNHFCAQQRSLWGQCLPLWDYYDGVEKQPVWIKDVVSGVQNAITNDAANGQIIQAVGPFRYNFYDLIEYMRTCYGESQKYDNYRITNLRWNMRMRFGIYMMEKLQKYPPLTWERVERDCQTDYVDPKLPTLEDLGVELTPLEMHIAVMAEARPKYHKYEIPYESALQIDLPKRLNLAA